MKIGCVFRAASCGIAIFVGANLCGSPASANTVQNPGFETGDFASWDFAAWSVQTNNGFIGPNSGTYFATTSQGLSSNQLTQSVPTVAGTTYDISFAYNAPIGPEALKLRWDGHLVTTIVGNTSGWIIYHFQDVATASTALLVFEPVFAGFMGIDDVSVEPTPLPAALPLFAGGLGTLGLLGWRRKKKAAALAA